MPRSLHDANEDARKEYATTKNDFADFPVGTDVKIISHCVDMHFFYGEFGKVTENREEYLGITVEFDKPRKFKGGWTQNDFNFGPSDLLKMPPVPRSA